MSKILITGSKGMLGQELVKEFRNRGHEVFGYDQDDFDITNQATVLERIKNIAPDLVINAAAYNGVDKIEENMGDCILAEEVNGHAVGYLAKACLSVGAPLVHYSSDYVFAGDRRAGYAEDDGLSPINKYGETKAEGETLLRQSGVKYYLIRLSRLFGPAGGGKKSFVDMMLDLAQQGRKEFKVVDEERGCPTYGKDLARFTRMLWEEKKPFGIYHGANTGACTWYEFALEIFKIKGLDAKVAPVSSAEFPRPAKRPAYSELLNTKLPKQRHWMLALEEYLKNK